MAVYLIIGIIVGALEMWMAYSDLKKYEISLFDVTPELRSLSNMGQAFVLIFTNVVYAIVWPLQVMHWIYRIYKAVFNKNVQETEGDSA